MFWVWSYFSQEMCDQKPSPRPRTKFRWALRRWGNGRSFNAGVKGAHANQGEPRSREAPGSAEKPRSREAEKPRSREAEKPRSDAKPRDQERKRGGFEQKRRDMNEREEESNERKKVSNERGGHERKREGVERKKEGFQRNRGGFERKRKTWLREGHERKRGGLKNERGGIRTRITWTKGGGLRNEKGGTWTRGGHERKRGRLKNQGGTWTRKGFERKRGGCEQPFALTSPSCKIPPAQLVSGNKRVNRFRTAAALQTFVHHVFKQLTPWIREAWSPPSRCNVRRQGNCRRKVFVKGQGVVRECVHGLAAGMRNPT